MHHKYTKEHKKFILEVSPGRYNTEIVDLFNAKFGTSLTQSQIKNFKTNHGIKSDVPRKRMTDPDSLFSKEQVDFIKKNVKWLSNQKLTDLVNETFNLSITVKQMRTWKKNHGQFSVLKVSEGLDPPNKGTKGLYNVGGNKTSFKKGQRPFNYKPVGSERINVDGYVEIKIADPNKWRLKHQVVWEQANGPIPKGQVVIFGDGNRLNLNPDNLILISRKQLVRLNQNNLISDNLESTKTGIIIADIYSKIAERKKANK